nr:cupin domain-containing protein [Lachnospiraceae bacterium]
MIIEFDKMEEKALPNFKGGEKQYDVKMFTEGNHKIMEGRLVPGASIGLHTHETDCEVIFLTEGNGKVVDDGKEYAVSAGMALFCPKDHSHTLMNNSDADLRFYAAVISQ